MARLDHSLQVTPILFFLEKLESKSAISRFFQQRAQPRM